MKTRRIAVAVLVMASLSVAACHSGNSGAGGNPSANAAAKSALQASIGTLATTTYAMTLITPQMNVIGAIDPVAGSVDVTMRASRAGQPVRIEDLAIQSASWTKIDLGDQNADYGIDPTKWLQLDPTRLTSASLPFDQAHYGDAFDMADVIAGVTSATGTDAQHFRGTIDLTGVVGVVSIVPAGSGLGAAATNLPFTATTDAQGRLTDLKVGGTDPSATFDFAISDYSAATAVDPPDDDDVVGAPAIAYGLLRADHMTP